MTVNSSTIDRYADIGNPGNLSVREDDMALYDPVTGRWQTLPAPPGYPPLAATPIWTGRELLALAASGNLLAFHS